MVVKYSGETDVCSTTSPCSPGVWCPGIHTSHRLVLTCIGTRVTSAADSTPAIAFTLSIAWS